MSDVTRTLIDKARQKNRVRHGKGLARVDLDRVDLAVEADDDTLLRVDEALTRLADEDPAGNPIDPQQRLPESAFVILATFCDPPSSLSDVKARSAPGRTAARWWRRRGR